MRNLGFQPLALGGLVMGSLSCTQAIQGEHMERSGAAASGGSTATEAPSEVVSSGGARLTSENGAAGSSSAACIGGRTGWASSVAVSDAGGSVGAAATSGDACDAGLMHNAIVADPPLPTLMPSTMEACTAEASAVASIANLGELRTAIVGAWIACPGTDAISDGAVGVEFRADGSWSALFSPDGSSIERAAEPGAWSVSFECAGRSEPQPLVSMPKSSDTYYYRPRFTVGPTQLQFSEGEPIPGAGRYIRAQSL
jgi:hypothetical protein